MAVDWERVNERLPYSKTDEGGEIIKILRHLDVGENDNQLCSKGEAKGDVEGYRRERQWLRVPLRDH